MSKIGIDDNVLIAGIVGVGALAFYSIYKTGNLLQEATNTAQKPIAYAANKIDNAQDWLSTGWKKYWGAPEWAWREVIGQGGIGLTGNEPESADARGFWKKDDNSSLWGWGPKGDAGEKWWKLGD